MEIKTENLEEKLASLTGMDYEFAEQEERDAGNNAVDVTFSKSYQARLAAKALDVNVFDLKELPIKDYVAITTRVSNFLFEDLAAEMRQKRTEKRQLRLAKSAAAE